MTSRRSDLQEDVRFRVLRLIDENPCITQRELANQLNLSLGGVNYCMKSLAERGLVKIQNFKKSSNKLAYTYLLTPKGFSEKAALTGRFLRRKMEEYEALRSEIEALQLDETVRR